MHHIKGTLASIVVAFLFFFSYSCIPAQPEKNKAGENRFVIADFQKLAPIHPFLTSTTLSAQLIDIVFEGLIRLDKQFVAQPHLAESWETSQNGLIWTFYIRKKVQFHDGSTLTAEDVAATYEALKTLKGNTGFSHIFQEIDSITVKDSYILQIVLKKPLAAFLQYLHVGILPKHLLAGKNGNMLPNNEELVGTGSYKLLSWSEQEVRLEAHQAYFLGKPHIDEIHVKVYPNRGAVWAKLMAGEVDHFASMMPIQFEILQQIPHFNFHSVSKPFYYLVAFNLNDPLFADPRVRTALNYAIDKKAILSKVLKDHASVAGGTIHPDSWAYNPKVEAYPYLPQKALGLLKEAGWEDRDGDHFLDKNEKPLQFTVHVNAGDDFKKEAMLLIQQHLLDIGVQVDVIFFDAAHIDFLFKKRFQTVFIDLLAVPDPDASYRFWHGSQIEDGFNFFSYNNPEVNRLLDMGRAETDPNRRKTLYFQYQEEMHQNPPGIFLFWIDHLIGIHQRFEGVTISSGGLFSNIHEWYVPKSQQRVAMFGNQE